MTCGEPFVPNPDAAAKSTNVMDAWIQATLQGLVQVRIGDVSFATRTINRRVCTSGLRGNANHLK